MTSAAKCPKEALPAKSVFCRELKGIGREKLMNMNSVEEVTDHAGYSCLGMGTVGVGRDHYCTDQVADFQKHAHQKGTTAG